MCLPPGSIELSGRVVGLLKCQYDLKHIDRELYFILGMWIVEKIGMKQGRAEPCVFRMIVGNEVSLMVDVLMGDIIVSGEL